MGSNKKQQLAGVFCAGVFPLGLVSTGVNAAIVGANVSIGPSSLAGVVYDGFNVTRDLDLLDWSFTTGTSFDDITNNYLNSGQVLDGFRYATDLEFLALAASANITPSLINVLFDPGDNSTLVTLQELVGRTLNQASELQSIAVFSESTSSGVHQLGNILVNQGSLNIFETSLSNKTQNSLSDLSSSANFGHALVRDSSFAAVPIPAAVWLFGSGLIGLIGIAKRKKA